MLRISAAELLARAVDGKHPVDARLLGVAAALPRGDLATSVAFSGIRRSRHWRTITPISISTMLSQLACLGVKWNSRRLRMRRASAGAKRSYSAAAECADRLSRTTRIRSAVRVVLVDEIAHALGEVEAGSLVGDLGVSPGSVHVDEHEDVRGAVAHVLVVEASRFPGSARTGLAPRRSAAAASRRSRRPAAAVGRLGVELEHVLHSRHEFGVDLRDAPHLLLPRLELHLGEPSTDRLAESVSCAVRRTISSASSSSVQRARPAGGFEHATATSIASSPTSSLRGARAGAARSSARSKPSSTKRCLVRYTVDVPTATLARSLVGRAGVGGEENLRPLEPANRPLPPLSERLQLLPSSEVSVTRYRIFMVFLDQIPDPMSSPPSPRFTEKQGQYLAFIHTYTLLNRQPPAEADFQRFFWSRPRRPHMIVRSSGAG